MLLKISFMNEVDIYSSKVNLVTGSWLHEYLNCSANIFNITLGSGSLDNVYTYIIFEHSIWRKALNNCTTYLGISSISEQGDFRTPPA